MLFTLCNCSIFFWKTAIFCLSKVEVNSVSFFFFKCFKYKEAAFFLQKLLLYTSSKYKKRFCCIYNEKIVKKECFRSKNHNNICCAIFFKGMVQYEHYQTPKAVAIFCTVLKHKKLIVKKLPDQCYVYSAWFEATVVR